jgi:hypothetical protein
VDRAELARVVAAMLPQEPARAARREERPQERREDPFARVREARRAERVDIERVVTTVQRRLAHQTAIERERRGLPR